MLQLFLTLQVLIPKGAYSGQKLMKLVKTKTAERTISTIPKVPVNVPVKYNTLTIAAIITLIILSAEPIFFFIIMLLFELNISKYPEGW